MAAVLPLVGVAVVGVAGGGVWGVVDVA